MTRTLTKLDKIMIISRTLTSIRSHRADKMSGIEKTRKKFFTPAGKKVIKKVGNAKRRRLLKSIEKI